MYTTYSTGFSDLPCGYALGQRPLDCEGANRLIRNNIKYMIERALITTDPVYKYINPKGVFTDPKIIQAIKNRSLDGLSSNPINVVGYVLAIIAAYALGSFLYVYTNKKRRKDEMWRWKMGTTISGYEGPIMRIFTILFPAFLSYVTIFGKREP